MLGAGFGRPPSGPVNELNSLDLQLADSARQLLARARDESERLNHEYIGTEHLALALTRQIEGVVTSALHNLRIDLAQVREAIEATVHPGGASLPAGADRPYTSRTRNVLSLANESAIALGQSEIGAEHLLIGLLREGTGIGGQILMHHGLSPDVVIDRIKLEKSGRP